uniref:Uncharacterized protein n=1 Tax=viral metagenome TaxID=1070528 RepID=A0A6H1ZYD4_9ZZZZ
MPKYGRILELVTPHVCTDEPVEFDLTPIDLPSPMPSEKNNKFVKKLNELSPLRLPNLDLDLKDRRPIEQVKSSAPESLLTHLRGMPLTIPAHDISDEPE